jgi:hypothetical protein
MERITTWIMGEKWRVWTAVAVLCVTFAFGFDSAFFRPKRLKTREIAAAYVALQNAIKVYDDTRKQVELEAVWFKPGLGYIDSFEADLNSAQILLDVDNGAQGSLNRAQAIRSYRKAIRFAREAVSKAQQAQQMLADRVTPKVDAIKKMKLSAFATQQELRAANAKLNHGLEALTKRYGVESQKYLSRYTTELAQKLKDSVGVQSRASVALTNAQPFLPLETDKTSKGDPRTANQHLGVAKVAIDELNTLMATVTSRLDYLAEADAKADTLFVEAKKAYSDSVGYVETVRKKTGYWLKSSDVDLGHAKSCNENCAAILALAVERGIADKPVAYEVAKSALVACKAAVDKADSEVVAAKKATVALSRFEKMLAGAYDIRKSAENAQWVLEKRHAQSEWQNVTQNLVLARRKIADSQSSAESAKALLDLSSQRFIESLKLAEMACSGLEEADKQMWQVTELSQSLEQYRDKYPNFAHAARSAINAESSNISRYGSSDSSARSDYNEAVSLLADAENRAGSKHYREACKKASFAQQKVVGTGTRAKRAHEAAEAAVAAAEAARQAASDWGSSSSSSSGSGWGSSSSGSYGGGFDSGGSHSSYDGGSHSSYSGGSHSDW